MDQTIEERGCHLFMAEHLRPVREIEIRGDAHAGPLVAVGEKLEQQFRRQMREGQIAHLVDQDEVEAPELRQELSTTTLGSA